MTSWTERYRAGEHRQVWDEMRSAGALAKGDRRRGDAEAVVEQTVAIIDGNLRLIERELQALGYRFLDPAPGAPLATMTSAIQNSAAEALLGHPGLSEADKQQFLASIASLVGSAAVAAPSRSPAPSRASAIGNPSTHLAALDDYREAGGPLPLLLDAIWMRVGWVDFLGGFGSEPEGALRPLAILPPVGMDDDYDQHLDDAEEGSPFYVQLMPDPRSLSADDPLIEVALTEGIDLRLPDGNWLLDHIRKAVSGGGFLYPDAAGSRRTSLDAVAAACAPF